MQVIADFRSFVILVEPGDPLDVIADDPADNKFLEAAVAGDCDFVVCDDPHLMRLGEYRGIQILTPAAFLVVLEQQRDVR